jgi:hypothetical protein
MKTIDTLIDERHDRDEAMGLLADYDYDEIADGRALQAIKRFCE